MEYKSASECVHCHICRDSCAFLSKYGIDIGDTERLRELAYHCFLCGRCTEVCPLHIDGRQTVLGLRRERVAAGDKQAVEKDYMGLLREKKDYIYRNWKHATSRGVFFPGCKFPSMYPKTTARISSMLA
ncbi:MAG: (Fe-S)-binding protein, partial [Mogibacterium sp.]|nr:(Fe-S)-binding protein [Mogibacterium sp.]